MKKETPKGSSASMGGHTPAGAGAQKKLSTPALVIIIVTAVLIVAVGIMVFLVVRKYDNLQQMESELNLLYPTTDTADIYVTSGEDDLAVPVESEPIDEDTGILPSFEELHKRNNDVIGFVKIPGSKLSTPVVQGKDNSYYLNHDYDKKNALGIPFADANAQITPDKQSNNVTIYGHSARDGSYFAPLKDFNTLEYYKEHPVVNFDTIYGKGTYKIIGAFIAKVKTASGEAEDPEWFNYHSYIDMTSAQFDTFVEEMNKRSFFKTGVDLTYGDQLISLSTCDTAIIPSGDTPYRMVVVARKVRSGESAAVDVSKATANTEMVMPQAWKDKYKKENPYK